MATITPDNRIFWKCPITGKREKITLPKATPSSVIKGFLANFERLVEFKSHGEEPDRKTRDWLRSLSPALQTKLTKAGLAGACAVPRTLTAFLDHYTEQRKSKASARTLVIYEQDFKDAKAFFGPDTDLTTITVGDAKAYSAWLTSEKRGLSVSSAAQKCKTLRAALQLAVDHDLIHKNPMADKGVDRWIKPASDAKRVMISQEDARKVMAELPSVEMRAWWALCRWGGVRIGEPLEMTWADVDFAKGLLHVPSPKTKHKGKERRLLPLWPELRQVLQELFDAAPEGEKRLLHTCRTTAWASKCFDAAIKRAGLPRWPQLGMNLRRSCENELAKAYPAHYIRAWFGHTKRVQEENYLRLTPEDYTAIVANAEAKFQGEGMARKGGEKQAQKTAQLVSEMARNAIKRVPSENEKTPEISGVFGTFRPSGEPVQCTGMESNH